MKERTDSWDRYEIHHFEKYHDEYTTEEELIHPEDIEHVCSAIAQLRICLYLRSTTVQET